MHFNSKYPNLYNFFGGYFSDADLFHLTDEDVIVNYKLDINSDDLQVVVRELYTLIKNPDDWQSAANEANRHFSYSIDILEWLNMIVNELSK